MRFTVGSFAVVLVWAICALVAGAYARRTSSRLLELLIAVGIFGSYVGLAVWFTRSGAA